MKARYQHASFEYIPRELNGAADEAAGIAARAALQCKKEMEEGHGWDTQSGRSNAGWAKISDRTLGLVDSMESVNLADYES